ncbi:hypothetical protein BE11_09995 [Sorangium cellulosum]|nr:hypothetical protein BE11_09995 [Sorangium cellulosum]
MYSPGEPSCDALDETFTMAPPAPPRRVDMRRTASRAHRKQPTTLVARMRCTRAAVMSSRRAWRSSTPALFTSAVTGPRAPSTVWNRRTTSSSALTSAATARATPPRARIASTTLAAAASSRR